MTRIIGQEKPSLDDLTHHGVKGMKWGVRRDVARFRSAAETSRNMGLLKTKSERAAAPKKPTRADKKAAKKQAKANSAAELNRFYQEKADRILATAAHDHESLIALKTHNDALIVTGKQFIDHLSKGGVMDISRTDVYAQRERGPNGKPTGPYVLNTAINQPFYPSHK